MLFSDSDLQCITDKIIMRKRDADVLFCHFNTIDVDKQQKGMNTNNQDYICPRDMNPIFNKLLHNIEKENFEYNCIT
jgi:hypothetical protein